MATKRNYALDGGVSVIWLDVDGDSVEYLPTHPQGPTGADGSGFFAFNESSRYVDGSGPTGTSVSCSIYAAVSTFSGECVLSGYLVPIL